MKLPLNSTFAYILIGIVLAFGINAGLALALSTDMPVVAVESNSMVPTFQRGDILVLQGVDENTLKVGDIIVFSTSSQSTPIVHRIVEINEDGTFQTKGDANTNQLPFERSIKPQQIHGKIVGMVPYMGWIKIGMSDYVMPNIWWIVVAGVVLYVLIFIIPNDINLKTKKKR